MSQADAHPFGECREGQIPRSPAAFDAPSVSRGVFDFPDAGGVWMVYDMRSLVFKLISLRFQLFLLVLYYRQLLKLWFVRIYRQENNDRQIINRKIA